MAALRRLSWVLSSTSVEARSRGCSECPSMAAAPLAIPGCWPRCCSRRPCWAVAAPKRNRPTLRLWSRRAKCCVSTAKTTARSGWSKWKRWQTNCSSRRISAKHLPPGVGKPTCSPIACLPLFEPGKSPLRSQRGQRPGRNRRTWSGTFTNGSWMPWTRVRFDDWTNYFCNPLARGCSFFPHSSSA